MVDEILRRGDRPPIKGRDPARERVNEGVELRVRKRSVDVWFPAGMARGIAPRLRTNCSRHGQMGKHALPLLANLLQCSHPVLNVISGSQLAVFHGEYIDRHCVKALARRFRSPQLPFGCPGSFTTHHDLIAEKKVEGSPIKRLSVKSKNVPYARKKIFKPFCV